MSYCKGKTKSGKICKRKSINKYCCFHGGQKLNPEASAFIPISIKSPPKKYIPPHLRKKKSSSPKKKSPPKKYIPPHLKNKKSSSQKNKKRFVGVFKKSPECVTYQYACKNSKYGNVYENKCRKNDDIDYMIGLRNQADKCAKLRRQNRNCRRKRNQRTTPKHDYAIDKIQKNADNCHNLINFYTTRFKVRH
jgi:hypothetical protein